MPIALPIAFLAALASTPPLPAPEPASAAVAAAARAAEKDGMVVGVSVLHLESGRTASHRGRERFQMASVFKVPVAIAVMDAVEKKRLALDHEVEVLPADRRTWGPIDDHWTPGMRVSVERMLDVMLVNSDNTAADLLIRLAGGPPAVEKVLVAKGVSGVTVSVDEKGLGEAEKKAPAAFERGAVNGASPDALARLLARLFRGDLLTRAATDRILDSMRRCATSDRRLRAGLPPRTEVADKTGSAHTCTNDAGIVTLPDGTHLVISVFVRGGTDGAKREAAIAAVARAAWEAFEPGH